MLQTTHNTGAHTNICVAKNHNFHIGSGPAFQSICDAIKSYCMSWCMCVCACLCYWGVNGLLVCPALSPTGLICEMTHRVKPILSDVSLIVAGSLEAHPQSSPVKAWRIWGLSDSVAITSRLCLSQCVWQGRQRGFRHREGEREREKLLTAVRHVV